MDDSALKTDLEKKDPNHVEVPLRIKISLYLVAGLSQCATFIGRTFTGRSVAGACIAGSKVAGTLWDRDIRQETLFEGALFKQRNGNENL